MLILDSGRSHFFEATDVLVNFRLELENFVEWTFGKQSKVARILGENVRAESVQPLVEPLDLLNCMLKLRLVLDPTL